VAPATGGEERGGRGRRKQWWRGPVRV